MSWHYLQGQEEVSSEDIYWDGERFAPSKSKTTLGEYCLPDNGTVSCRISPFGMTLRRSTGPNGGGVLTWYQADFHVRTYQPPEKGPELTEPEADCGPSSPGSLARYNPGSRSWKTAQSLLLGGLESYSETWPRWGTMRTGELFPLPTPFGISLLREVISQHLTTFGSESGSGQRAPTPKASPSGPDFARMNREGSGGDDLATAGARVPTPKSEDSQCAGGHRGKDDTLYGAICRPKRLPTGHGFSKDGGKSNGPSGNELGRSVNRLPTPRANESTESLETQQAREARGVKASKNLTSEVERLPSPTSSMMTTVDMEQAKYAGISGKRPSYQEAKRLTTPCADDTGHRKEKYAQGGTALSTQAGGSLNPPWVEWLHGWIIGWTDLKPLGMDKFRQHMRSHGIS